MGSCNRQCRNDGEVVEYHVRRGYRDDMNRHNTVFTVHTSQELIRFKSDKFNVVNHQQSGSNVRHYQRLLVVQSPPPPILIFFSSFFIAFSVLVCRDHKYFTTITRLPGCKVHTYNPGYIVVGRCHNNNSIFFTVYSTTWVDNLQATYN